MAIDPSIALGVKPIELPNQLAQYGQLAAIQSAQNQNALAQYQLGAARRAEEKDIARTNALAKAGADPDAIEKALLETGDIKTYAEVRKARRETDAAGVKLLTDKLALLPEAYKRADTPEAYLALHKSIHADPVVGPWLSSIGATPEKGLATLGNAVKTGKFDDLRVQSMQSVSQVLEGLKPMVVGASSSVFNPKTGTFSQAPAAPERTDTDLIRNYNAAKAQGFTGSIFDYERKIKEAGRPPAQAPTPSAPVAVVDPVTGKQVLVSREEALSKRMTPAAAMETLPPKEIQKREAAYPQATSIIKGFESKSDAFIKDLEKLRDHPGLSQITGLIAGRVPALTAEGRAAQAQYDKVVAKGGFQALQDLRDASKTGGALGNVSNQEGKQLTASFAAIDRRQDAKDVKAALDDAISNVQGAKTRMREAYDSTYSYKAGAAPATPSGATVSNW